MAPEIHVDVSDAPTKGRQIDTVRAKTGDTIRFEASKKRTLVAIPKADELFGHSEWHLAFTLEADGPAKNFEVKKRVKTGEAPVAYHYAVYCEGAVDFAEGEASSPVLLIGPP